MEESPHKCPVCNRSFNQRSNLKTHLLTHTDIKPYNCTACGKVFRRNCDLRRHSLTHNLNSTPASANASLLSDTSVTSLVSSVSDLFVPGSSELDTSALLAVNCPSAALAKGNSVKPKTAVTTINTLTSSASVRLYDGNY